MAKSRTRQARIRLVAQAKMAFDRLQERATPDRLQRFHALNRTLALLALGSI
jgi:hypothetical protein